MKKALLLSILALSLVAVVIVFAATASSDQKTEKTPNANQSVTPITEENPDPVIVRLDSSPLFNTGLSGQATLSNFYVRAGHGHIKIFVKNTRKYKMTVTMKHSSGKVYIEDSVPAGGTLDWRSYDDYPQGVRGGEFEVSYRAGGNNMSGQAWGTSAKNNNEL